MAGYIPGAKNDRETMLAALGHERLEDLYAHIPGDVPRVDQLKISSGKSELEVRRQMEAMAARNTVFPTVFRGAGAYRHFIPSIVPATASKEEFVTAYTPYQAEISQGILQNIFEYQTMICDLTGMDASNASVYDGASAAAEAAAMCRERSRATVLLSEGVHPDTARTVKTYCDASGMAVELLPLKDGVTDLDAAAARMNGETACLLVQSPNFFGLVEDGEKAATIAHEGGAKLIMSCTPFALALYKTPGECGADIAVGDGQPLGIPMSFGGPAFGFMACTGAMTRKLPGRIVGQTTDMDGKRAFVLTLQAREQHIRREKASSNVCSNQAHAALTAAIYMASMGASGVKEVAHHCYAKAHYAAAIISVVPGFDLVNGGEFFHEFVTRCPVSALQVEKALAAKGILGGLPIGDDRILWCVTEMNTKEEIDGLAEILREVRVK